MRTIWRLIITQLIVPSVPPVIEVINETMREYSFAPTSETKLTNPMEVKDAIRVSHLQGSMPRWYSQQGLEASSNQCRFVLLFIAIFRPQYLPSAWKLASVTDLVLSTRKSIRHDWQTSKKSCPQNSLRIDRTRITARRVIWFRPKNYTALHLARGLE